MSRVKKVIGPSFFVISSFMIRAISIVTTPIFTRLINENEFGVVSVYNSWSGIFSAIFTLSIAANAFNKGMADFEDDKDFFMKSMLGLTACSVGFGFLVMLIAQTPITRITGLNIKYFYVMFVSLYSEVAVAFWNLRNKYDSNYIKVAIVNILMAVCSVVCSILCVLYIDGDKAFIKVASNAAFTILFAVLITIKYMISSNGQIKKYWKYALVFCIPLIPHYLARILLNQSDRIMINAMVGSDKAGIYTVCHTAVEILTFSWSAVCSIYIPWLYKKLKNRDKSYIKDVNSFILYLVFGVLILVDLLAPEYVKILATEQYYEGIYVVAIAMAGGFCLFVCNLMSNSELFRGRDNKVISFATIFITILNILLNYIFIKNFGYIAAAYTTYICYIIMFCIHIGIVKKDGDCDLYNIHNVVLMIVGSGIASIAVPLLYNTFWVRIVVVAIYSIIFAIFLIYKLKYFYVLLDT